MGDGISCNSISDESSDEVATTNVKKVTQSRLLMMWLYHGLLVYANHLTLPLHVAACFVIVACTVLLLMGQSTQSTL